MLIPARNLLTDDGEIVCLIKPQFEAGREKVGKKGVVRESSVHEEVIETVMKFAIQIGFEPIKLDYSPIKGPEGNIEYLLYIKKNVEKIPVDDEWPEIEVTGEWEKEIKESVVKSHDSLK